LEHYDFRKYDVFCAGITNTVEIFVVEKQFKNHDLEKEFEKLDLEKQLENRGLVTSVGEERFKNLDVEISVGDKRFKNRDDLLFFIFFPMQLQKIRKFMVKNGVFQFMV
jgi:hypothetical protein